MPALLGIVLDRERLSRPVFGDEINRNDFVDWVEGAVVGDSEKPILRS